MTLTATPARIDYNGNGTTYAFSIPFAFWQATDLVVVWTVIATGIATTKVLTTDFVISGTQDALGHFLSGATITFQLPDTTPTPPPSGTRVTIYRDPPLIQDTDLTENSGMPAETVEATLDYLTMLVQRSRVLIAQTLRQPDSDTTVIANLPNEVARANKYLGFDGTGKPVAVDGTSSTIVVSTFGGTLIAAADAPSARLILGLPAVAAKGDLFVGTGPDTLTKLAVGADGTVLVANAASPGGVQWAVVGSTTGDGKITLKNTPDTGWIMADDGTIGDAVSGASNRANADCQALFLLLWNNVVDTWAPVVGGRGANAAADWAAHKKITLTKTLGRALACAGAGSGLTSRALGENLGAEDAIVVTHNHGVTDPGHSHTQDPNTMIDAGVSVLGNGAAGAGDHGHNTGVSTTGITINNAGSSGTGKNMQPSSFWNVMIKL